MRILQGLTWPTCALAYSGDGRLLASGFGLDGVRLWDTATGQPLLAWKPETPYTGVSSLALDAVGEVAAVGLYNGEVSLWFTADGRPLRSFPVLEGTPTDGNRTLVAFAADGQHLVAARGQDVGEWRINSGTCTRRLPIPMPWNNRLVNVIACARDGRIAAGHLNAFTVWTNHRGSERTVHWPGGEVLALAFSPIGDGLAVARGRQVALWEPRESSDNPYRKARVMRHDEVVRACTFTPDGRRLLTAGDDWTVHLWDVHGGTEVSSFNWRMGPIQHLAVSPDGMTAALGACNRPEIVVWDLE
jgi:WD40 repeat protein